MGIELKKYYKPEVIEYGELLTFETKMVTFPDKRDRTIRVWLPEGYDGKRRYPVMYMHDAQNLFVGAGVDEFKWYIDREMRALKNDNIEVIIVGIDTSDDRGSELLPPYKQDAGHPIPHRPGTPEPTACGHLYADFVRDYLKPIIDENFKTLPDAANTGVGGASMAGLQSFYMALRDPDVFGRALVFSPAFAIMDKSCMSLIEQYDASRLANSRIFIFNGDQNIDAELLGPAIEVYRVMKEKLGLNPTQIAMLVDSRETHYMTAWNKYFPESMRYLYSEDNSRPSPPAHTQNVPRR